MHIYRKGILGITMLLSIFCLGGCIKDGKILSTDEATSTTGIFSPSPSFGVPNPAEGSSMPTESNWDYPIDNTHIPENTVLVNEQNNDQESLFYLGMTKDDVIHLLEANDIRNYDTTEITNYEGSWDWGNYVINVMIHEGNLQLFFDKDTLLLYCIKIYGSSKLSSTQLGLKTGDSYDQMISLYEKEDVVYDLEDDGKVYEYSLGDHYFQVVFLFDIVHSWSISEYKFEQSDVSAGTSFPAAGD